MLWLHRTSSPNEHTLVPRGAWSGTAHALVDGVCDGKDVRRQAGAGLSTIQGRFLMEREQIKHPIAIVHFKMSAPLPLVAILPALTPAMHIYTALTFHLHLNCTYFPFAFELHLLSICTYLPFTLHLLAIYIALTCHLHCIYLTFALNCTYFTFAFELHLLYICIALTLHLHCTYCTFTFSLTMTFTIHLSHNDIYSALSSMTFAM